MINLLVTGLTGFVGQAMRQYLPDSPMAARVRLLGPASGFDLLDPLAVQGLVRESQPDWVIHLAAQSHVPTSFKDPARTLQINTIGTANLLQALANEGFAGRLLYVSSADIYGAVGDDDLPVHETLPPAPRNPYAVSKAAAELLCLQWRRAHGLDVVVVRPFNHVGPGQRPDFALSGFARDIAAIALNRQAARIIVGDLEVTRDFCDVRDVLDAYFLLLAQGHAGEIYNVCSEQEYLLRDLLQEMLVRAGVQAEIISDPARFRPAEQRRMCGSHAKITAHTGWKPHRVLTDTLDQLVDYWKKEQQL